VIRGYLSQLDRKLKQLAPIISSSSVQREFDANLNIGFIKGRIIFIDGSVLDFAERISVQRPSYRFHYMDSENNLIIRWDSAPHFQHLSTFPFHRHTPRGVEACEALNLLGALTQIERVVKL